MQPPLKTCKSQNFAKRDVPTPAGIPATARSAFREFVSSADDLCSGLEVDEIDLSGEIGSEFAAYALYQFAYRRELLKGLAFPPYTVGEDLVFVCEALARAKTCAVLTKDEYAYRHRAGSAMMSAGSARKLRDRIGYHRDMFAALAASDKQIGAAFTRGRGNGWIEAIPADWWPHRKEPDWAPLWTEWLESFEASAESLKLFSRWQKFAVRGVTISRAKMVVWLFCVVPYQLKRRGLHR